MPQCLRDSVIVPIPKGNKVASCSSNYRPVALSSNLSKVLERLILSKYEKCSRNIVLNQASLPLCVPVQSFPDTFIMGRLSSVASLML